MPFPQFFGKEFSGDFGEPIINTGETTYESGTDQNIMDVCYYEIRICQAPVHRHHRKSDTAQATYGEFDQKGGSEKHRGGKTNGASPHCCCPVEYFDASRNSNQHTAGGKKCVKGGSQSYCEHMMCPYPEGQEHDRYRRSGNEFIAENRFSGKHRYYF